jgi:hypothetical protein
MGTPAPRLRAVAVACLRRVLHLSPDLGAAVDELESAADLPFDPARPARVPPFVPAARDPEQEVGNAVRVLADAGRSAAGVQPWTVQDVAGRCARALAFGAHPPRALLSFPLPPGLERYRAEVAAALPADGPEPGDWWEWVPRPQGVLSDAARGAYDHLARAAGDSYRERRAVLRAEEAAHCDLARDVLGYAEAVVRFDPDWRTGTVLALARGMVASADYSPMPILGDALMDAGCPGDDEVAVHCRLPAPHVRRCWVLDLILGAPGGAA